MPRSLPLHGLLLLLLAIGVPCDASATAAGPSVMTINGQLVFVAPVGSTVSIAYVDPVTQVLTAPEPIITRSEFTRELQALRAEFAQNTTAIMQLLAANATASQTTAAARLAQETSRAQVIENDISANLSGEVLRAVGVEASLSLSMGSTAAALSAAVGTEASRARAAEALLAANITAGDVLLSGAVAQQAGSLGAVSSSLSAVSASTAAVAGTASAATAALATALSTNINALSMGAASSILAVAASVATAATSASAAAAALSTALVSSVANIGTSMAAQAASILSVSASVAGVANAASSAVGSLSAALVTNTNTLSSGIAVVAAQASNTALLSTSVASLSTALSTEISRAIMADAALSTAVRPLVTIGLVPGQPAPSIASLLTAGATSGATYYLLVNGVSTPITYRVYNGVPYAISTTASDFNTFASSWRYSGTITSRGSASTSLGGVPEISTFNYAADGSWTSVSINTDYVPDVEGLCWYVRRRFYIAGNFVYSGTVDDDEVWTLVSPSGTTTVIGGDVADTDGSDAHSWSNRGVTVPAPSVYVFAGRGCEGGGADYLIISSIDSGLGNFFEILASG